MNNVFWDNVYQPDVIHVLAVMPTRTLVCAVPGARTFGVEANVQADVNRFAQAIVETWPAHFAGVDALTLELYSLVNEEASFLIGGEDANLLRQGDISDRINAIISRDQIDGSQTVGTVFGDLVYANAVQVMVIDPARTYRRAHPSALGKCTRLHWNALNEALERLKRSVDEPALLSKIAWEDVESKYWVKSHPVEPSAAGKELAYSV